MVCVVNSDLVDVASDDTSGAAKSSVDAVDGEGSASDANAADASSSSKAGTATTIVLNDVHVV